jgi:hypothetical protein
MEGFTNERFFFGMFGPLNADDDNFITRWLVTHGWKIKFQNSKDATLETTLGTYPKFLSQCLRWVRTTWRSNSASLFTDRTVWKSQPWCVYAVYITSFFNFALFYDAALLCTLHFGTNFGQAASVKISLAALIFSTKMVKLVPHFARCPADVVYIPGYVAFAYYHSLIKLYAGLTFYVTAWGGRNLAAVGAEDADTGEDDTDSVAQQVQGELSDYANDMEDAINEHHILEQDLFANSPKNHEGFPGTNHGWAGRKVIQTPWGVVNRRGNASILPANILESQSTALPRSAFYHEKCAPTIGKMLDDSGAAPEGVVHSLEMHMLMTTGRYGAPAMGTSREWNRGIDCGRQHDGNLFLNTEDRCVM